MYNWDNNGCNFDTYQKRGDTIEETERKSEILMMHTDWTCTYAGNLLLFGYTFYIH